MSPAFRPDIQGLRAIAVLLVVVFHAGLPLSGGFVGVDVFFVISGYVISAMLLREQQQAGRIDLRQFYRRRIFRLLPALALTVSVTLVISALVLSPYAPQLNAAAVGAAGLIFGANIVLSQLRVDYFTADLQVNPLTHLWSLAVEGQFYLLFPLLLRGNDTRHWRRNVLLLSSVSFAWMLSAPLLSLPPALQWLDGYYAAPGRFWQFGIGALAALLPPLNRRPAAVLVAGSGGLLISTAAVLLQEGSVPGLTLLLPTIGSALLLSSVPVLPPLQRLLSLRPMTTLGDLSYSWYLWHWPLIVFAGLLWPTLTGVRPLAALISLLPAVLSYRLIERPLRDAGQPSARRNLGLLAGAAALSCLGTALIAVYWWQPQLLPAERIIGRQPAVTDTVFCRTISAGIEAICSEQGAQRNGTPIYLIGDSQAEMLIDAVSGAAATLDRPLYAVIKRACPLPAPPGRRADCSGLQQRIADWLAAARPGDVILAQNRLPGSDSDGLPSRAEPLITVLAPLTDSGHHLLLVNRIPMFTGRYAWQPDRCTLWSLLHRDCGPTLPLEVADRRNAVARELYSAVAARLNAEQLELGPLICLDGQCRPLANGEWRYADANHLTRAFAATLAPAFVTALQSTP